MNTANCSALALCRNTPGSYDCVGNSALLCLDGATDYGRAAAMTSTLATATTVTVEFWFRSTNATGERQFFVFHPADLNAARLVSASIVDASAQTFGSLTGRIIYLVVDARDSGGSLNARGFQIAPTIASFDETKWHHYAIVLSGTTQRAFVDGIELTTTQQRDGAQNTSFVDAFGSTFVSGGGVVTLDLGWFPRTAIRYAAGAFDNFKISSSARYTAPFSPPHPLVSDASTVALYGLHDGTGNQSTDTGSHGYTITWTGITNTSWGPCPRKGLSFNGTTDGVSTSKMLSRGTATTFTAEYWIKPHAIGGANWMKILNIHNATNRDVDMEIRPDGHVYCTLYDQGGVSHGSTSASVLSAGTWYHVACSYDGTNQRMFVNGTLETTTAWTGAIQLNDAVTISGYESRFVNADIDEFRLSSTARYTASFTAPPNLLNDAGSFLLWNFDEGAGTTSADSSGHGFGATLGTGPNVTTAPTWVAVSR